MLVLNKWNGRTYRVIKIEDRTVTLERLEEYFGKPKGEFQVDKYEYFFSYVPKKVVDIINYV